MEEFDVDNFNEGNVSIEISSTPNNESVIRMNFLGSLDMENSGEIVNPFFSEVHNKVLSTGIELVELDMREFQFMNSRAIGAFISWFTKVAKLPDSKKYRINILYNKNVVWQAKGLKVMKNFLPKYLELLEG